MSSRRLPGKVLMSLAGTPVLDHLTRRLEQAERIGEIVISTSTDPSDDPIASHCESAGLSCHRGSLDDVAGRLLAAAEERGLDAFVRVSGDSPLLDQRLVDHAAKLFLGDDLDLVTNVFPRTFPPGQSVEVLSVPALRSAHESMRTDEEREHVTLYLYEQEGEFKIRNFSFDGDRGDARFTLDTRADAALLERLIVRMGPQASRCPLEEMLRLRAEINEGVEAP